jgi:hypothetical protein
MTSTPVPVATSGHHPSELTEAQLRFAKAIAKVLVHAARRELQARRTAAALPVVTKEAKEPA